MSVSLFNFGRPEAEDLSDARPRGARISGFGYRTGKFSGIGGPATGCAYELVLDAGDNLSLGRIERLHVVGDLVAPVDGVSVGPTHRVACQSLVYCGRARMA